MNHVQSRLSTALAATLTLGVATISMAAPAQADPPGNNGTVKVAPYGEVDGIPQNTPHAGCVFDVEWYGFDEGEEIVSEVSFESWAPTAVPMTVDGPGEVFVGEDPATGAGTGTDGETTEGETQDETQDETEGETATDGTQADEEVTEQDTAEDETAEDETAEDETDPAEETEADNGFDGEASYTLAFEGEPHAQQGYHVRLTIHTPGSQGADVKHKMFWVEDCAAEQPAGEEATAEPEVSEPADETEVAGEQAEEPQISTQVEVLGEQEEAPAAAAGETVEQEVAPTAVDAGLAGTTLAAATSPLGALVVLAGLLLVAAALLLRRAQD